MACEFSKDGKYFAELSTEGKLKIWNAASNVFEQEYTPSYHLKTPLTCFSFITGANKVPRRKKRKIDEDSECVDGSQTIGVGTSSGKLLIYSIVKGDVEYTINDETNRTIRCLSSSDDGLVYSGVDQNVVVWNLQKRNVLKQWKAGNDRVCSILVIPDKNQLLTASRNIKLWDLKTQTELKTYTGHASEVSLLHYVSPGKSQSTQDYFLSGSKNDRTLNCWNLSRDADGKATAASFLMEDIPKTVSVCADPHGSTWLAVTVRSGITHVYCHTLNGKSKLLKPKKHIQVISDSTKPLQGVVNISISAAVYQDLATLRLAYGNEIVHVFEDIDPIKYKYAIVRQDPCSIAKSTEVDAAKVKAPIVGNDVHYLGPQTSNSLKRKSQGKHQELAMQNRFENLTLNHLDGRSTSSAVPKSDNVAQLLMQGLHSNDKKILRSALLKRNPETVKNTIKRLPALAIVPLVKKLTEMMQGKTLSSQIGVLWLKNVLLIHASILMANPEMPDLLNVAISSIQTRMNLQANLNKLRGRLDLLLGQVHASTEPNSYDYAPALTIVDKDSDASDNDAISLDGDSGSDYDWLGEDEVEEAEEEEEEEGDEGADIEVDGEIADEMDESD